MLEHARGRRPQGPDLLLPSDGGLEASTRLERRHFGGLDLDLFAGTRVAGGPGGPCSALEGAEAGELEEDHELVVEEGSQIASDEGVVYLDIAVNKREPGLGLSKRRVGPKRWASCGERAIDLYVLAGATKEVAITYRLLGDLQRSAGDVEASLESYRTGLEALGAGTGDPL